MSRQAQKAIGDYATQIQTGGRPVTTNTPVNRDGIGFFGLLTIVFITLKLTGHIAWSWLWVLAPLWGPLAFVLSVGVVVLVVLGIAALVRR